MFDKGHCYTQCSQVTDLRTAEVHEGEQTAASAPFKWRKKCRQVSNYNGKPSLEVRVYMIMGISSLEFLSYMSKFTSFFAAGLKFSLPCFMLISTV